jgi:hypothetical protein
MSRQFGEDQQATVGGGGTITAPVHRRPAQMVRDLEHVDRQDIHTRPVRFQVRPRLPVFARAGAVVMGETEVGERRVQMPVGDNYEAVVPLPWGGEHVKRFDVPAGDGEI